MDHQQHGPASLVDIVAAMPGKRDLVRFEGIQGVPIVMCVHAFCVPDAGVPLYQIARLPSR